MTGVYLYVLEDKGRSEAAKELVLESLLDLSTVAPYYIRIISESYPSQGRT